MKEQTTKSAIGITTRVKINSADLSTSICLLTRLTIESAKFAGLLNAEISPPEPGRDREWTVIQRFRTAEQADAWRESKIRRETLEQLSQCASSNNLNSSNNLTKDSDSGHSDETSQHECVGSVAACISSEIKPGMEEEYCTWLNSIQAAQAQFPGYQGTYLQLPTSSMSGLWTTLLRFNTPESLDNWFKSKQRLELIEQAKHMVASENIHRMESSFPGWMPIAANGSTPANWKAAMLVLLGLYPIIVLQIRFLNPCLQDMRPSLATFILNTFSVALVTFVTMPFLTKTYRTWLLPPAHSDRLKIDLTGAATILVLYLIENLLLWHLF